jgi:hypothetical protein
MDYMRSNALSAPGEALGELGAVLSHLARKAQADEAHMRDYQASLSREDWHVLDDH